MKKRLPHLLTALTLTYSGVPATSLADDRASSSAWFPFELRLFNPKHRFAKSFAWDSNIKIQTPGSLDPPKFKISFQDIEIQGTDLILNNFSIRVESALWHYQQSSFVDVTCHHPQLRLDQKRFVLPLPRTLALSWNGPLKTLQLAQVDLLSAWAGEQLSKLFAPAFLAQNVSFTADCPGNFSDVIGALLRARLENYNSKDKASYESFLKQFTQVLSGELRLDALLGPQAGLFSTLLSPFPSSELRWLQLEGPVPGWRLIPILGVPTGMETAMPLSDAAQKLLSNSWLPWSARDPLASGMQIIVSPRALSVAVSVGLGLLSGRGGFVAKPGEAPFYELEEPLQSKDISSFLPELQEQDESLKARIVFAGCDGKVSYPEILPYVSQGGSDLGMDLKWSANVEIRRASDGVVLSKRRISRLEAGFFLNRNRSTSTAQWEFQGGHAESLQSGCESLLEIPPEMSLTMDWMLQAPTLIDVLNRGVLSALSWSQDGADFRFRVIGQASSLARRAKGGYWAEALVFEGLL